MQFSGSVPVRLFPPPSTGEGEGGGVGGGKGSKAQEGEGKIENYMALARGRLCLTVGGVVSSTMSIPGCIAGSPIVHGI
jgi:hypothetical protein